MFLVIFTEARITLFVGSISTFPDTVIPVAERICSTPFANVPGVTKHVYSDDTVRRRSRRRNCLCERWNWICVFIWRNICIKIWITVIGYHNPYFIARSLYCEINNLLYSKLRKWVLLLCNTHFLLWNKSYLVYLFDNFLRLKQPNCNSKSYTTKNKENNNCHYRC